MEKLNENEIQLLLSLKNGDKSAFKSIFNRYEQRLFCFVFSMTKSKYATEEILQEVFIKLWTKRESIDTSYSFGSFIYTIAKNCTYNFLRRVANNESLKEELWRNVAYINNNTYDAIFSKEYEDILNCILDNIPTRKRSIFILSRQGKSNQEIADLLGTSIKTVKNHLWKTKQLIRIRLQPYILDTTVSLIFFTYAFY